MIIRHYGGLELLAIICALTTFVACTQNETEQTTETPTVFNNTELKKEDNSTTIENAKDIEKLIPLEENSTTTDDIEKLVKSHRRAPRYDAAGSTPWVRVYNRQGGKQNDVFFNYETRVNTSAHTSGEGWDPHRKEIANAVIPINRRESKGKVQDLLRVKPKAVVTPSPKQQETTQISISSKTPSASTKAQVQIPTTLAPAKNDSQNKGYIIWKSNDGGPSGGWALDDPKTKIGNGKTSSVDDLIPKDGTRWKVVGEGGDDGWQVVDDKGDVEWKIEYDDGEWRVTSTGDIPDDAEWVDPEYVWGPVEGSVSEDDEYNSWATDDYSYSPWVEPIAYVRGIGNHTWPKSSTESQIAKSSEETSTTGGQNTIAEKLLNQPNPKELIRFGTRRKVPEKDTSSAQERTDEVKNDTTDDSKNKNDETPQADQVVIKGKSWVPNQPIAKPEQKWVQGYGVKSWEVDNTGWNSGFGGETWVTANKDFPTGSWVPKTALEQVQEVSKNTNAVSQESEVAENPIRAWGTGYGSKTWKGNEWDSNVVWKTGFGGALPWTSENSTTWKFPDESKDSEDQVNKKNIVWSQPIPSDDDEPITNPKPTNLPKNTFGGVRIKWPTKPTNSGNIRWKTPPSRRTEDESWGDDSSEGGVIWKEQSTDTPPTDATIGDLSTKANIDLSKGWKTVDWTNNKDGEAKPLVFSWKNNPPQKTSNLISVNWKSDESVTNDPPAAWNQGQSPPAAWNQGQSPPAAWNQGQSPPAAWNQGQSPPAAWNQGQSPPAAWNQVKGPPTVWNQGQGLPAVWPGGDQNNFPTWIFGGCKLTIKCGSTESDDTSEDDSNQTTPPDTSDDDSSMMSTDAPPTTVAKGWPINQYKGKSWRPPTKSWKPPTKSWKPPKKSWRPPTSKQPPPTMPDTPPPTPPPTMSWKMPTPPANMKWKKPPPGWKKPPPGMSWKQPTPPTTMLWTESTTSPPSMSWKPPPPPPSMKWKKPGPRPTKSWRPPPTKSWKPPPTKSWKPPTGPGKTWQPSIATPAPDAWITQTKPDCKDATETAPPTPEPNMEDEDEEMSPPQIIIITKLPNNPKGTANPPTDKWDTKDDSKVKKPPSKSWMFPSRKVSQKGSKNRKDIVGRKVNKWPVRPQKVSKPGPKPGNKIKGWPKGMPPPNFTWPGNSMRRWTTKRPSSMSNWKPPKYMKTKAWKQMLRKWMNARL